MANKDIPRGFRPHGPVLRASQYVAAAAIYPGDLVKPDSGGKVARAAASDTGLLGVALSYASADGANVLVADDPNQRFVAQADDGTIDAQTDIGLNYDIVVAADTTYLNSAMEIDASTQNTTATLPIKVLAVEPKIDNALGTNVDCICVINSHALKGHTGTAGV
jgi:hypothetical protein